MARDIFVKRGNKVEPGFNIGIALSRKETKGDVGIEIEVEGNKFPKPEGYEGTHHPVQLPGTGYWSYVHDGSLRGKDNAEYVLSKPILFSEVDKAVDEIFSKMKTFGSVLDDSNRTSVHVHLNCQKFHFNRLASLIALYVVFEEVLTEYCGDHRVGNLFCLRAKDAPAALTNIREFIRSDGKVSLSENLHYAGLNTHALTKYGSLEIRSLRGATEPGVIKDWVAILRRLYELSGEMSDPRDIPNLFSMHGPLSFFEHCLGDKTSVITSAISFNLDRISDSMYEGMRLAQDLCYCRDWDAFKAIDVQPDPFGRDSKKMAKRLMTMGLTEAPDSSPAPAYGGILMTNAWATAMPGGTLPQQAVWNDPLEAFDEGDNW